MNRILKLMLIFVGLFYPLFVSANTPLETGDVIGYQIEVSDLDENISKDINSLRIEINDKDDWKLIVNNRDEYTPSSVIDGKYIYKFNIALSSYKVKVEVNELSCEIKQIATVHQVFQTRFQVKIKPETNEYYLRVFPDYQSENNDYFEVSSTNHETNFGIIKVIYDYNVNGVTGNKQVSYEVSYDQSKKLISINGKDIDIDKGLINVDIILDYKATSKDLDLSYLDNDKYKMNWNNASKYVYTINEIDELVGNSFVDLVHQPSGETITVPLESNILTWSKNENGSWNTNPVGSLQVIYPYQPEGIETKIKGVTRIRSYSTFSTYDYKAIEEGLKGYEVYEHLGYKEYKAYTLNTAWSGWSGLISGVKDCTTNPWCESRNYTYYKWYKFGDWTGYSTTVVSPNSDRQVRVMTKYSQVRYGSWNNWSSWTTSYQGTSSTKERKSKVNYKYYKKIYSKNRYSRYKRVCSKNWRFNKTVYGSSSYATKCPSGYSNKSGRYEYKVSKSGGNNWWLNTANYTEVADPWDTYNYNFKKNVYTLYYYSSAPTGYKHKSSTSKVFYSYRTRSRTVYKTWSKPSDSWNYSQRAYYSYRNKSYSDYVSQDNSYLESSGYRVDYSKRKHFYEVNILEIISKNYYWDRVMPSKTIIQYPTDEIYDNKSRYVDPEWLLFSEINLKRNPTGKSKVIFQETLIRGIKTLNTSEVLYKNDILNNAQIVYDGALMYQVQPQLTSSRPIDINQFYSLYHSIRKSNEDLNEAISSRNNYLSSKRFAPRVFLTTHYRGVKKEVTIPRLSHVSEFYGFNEKVSLINEAILIELPQKIKQQRYRFFDYQNPFPNNDLPSNFENESLLIEEITNVNFDLPQFKIELSKNDILNIKNWLKNGGYQSHGTGEILKRFKNIFRVIQQGSVLEEFLNE